ncbi:MAG: nucleotidyltransferase domain-containing protein [Myxococcota bacterium]|jgi:predicted nucleotidyltransferase
MTDREMQILSELKRRISLSTTVTDFCLYGSRTRGDADSESDMDVFLEVPEINRELKDNLSDIAWEVGFENDIYISLMIFTKDEIENSPLRASPLLANIREEGQRI